MTQRKPGQAEELHKTALDLLGGIQELKEKPEFKALVTAMKTVCRELSVIVVKDIAGDEINNEQK